MSRLRSTSPGVGVRLRALQQLKREGGLNPGPGRDCTGNDLGERLGIAALYAGRGDTDNANAAALLAIAGVEDSERARAAVLAAIEDVRALVRRATGGLH